MTREELLSEAKEGITQSKYLILELITGYGKTKLAIDCVNYNIDTTNKINPSILILVAKSVHKQTWMDEIDKWGGIKSNNITIECYNSLYKYRSKSFDYIIADEMHHLSDNRMEYLKTINITKFIGLSATIKQDMMFYFKNILHAKVIKCGIKEAVEDEVLPSPTVYLWPLTLDSKDIKYTVTQFNKSITTTQRGAYKIMSKEIEWYRNRRGSVAMKRVWLHKAKERLNWLSVQKEEILEKLLHSLKNERILLFCSSIAQTQRMCKNSITSKSKNANTILDKFNKNKIKHISAVDILNEGVNLVDCRIGIFGVINASEIMSKQKVGRLLRHKSPIVIIPYFKDTREEEIVANIITEYDSKNVKPFSEFML